MKTAIFAALFIFSSLAVRADTFLYRVTTTISKVTVKQSGDTIGKNDVNQPYFGTYALTPPDTNYYLLKVTPASGADPALDIALGYEIYQIQKLDENGFIRNLIDNSKARPIEKNWSVGISSK